MDGGGGGEPFFDLEIGLSEGLIPAETLTNTLQSARIAYGPRRRGPQVDRDMRLEGPQALKLKTVAEGSNATTDILNPVAEPL